MEKYCIILIYNTNKSKILMCHRIKQPYLGLKNLVGGRIEKGEKAIDAAYREMEEETSITKDDITLRYLMHTKYFLQGISLDVFAGTLKRHVEVHGDENPLCWVDADDNFFDITRYAGDGNLGHILISADKTKEELYGE